MNSGRRLALLTIGILAMAESAPAAERAGAPRSLGEGPGFEVYAVTEQGLARQRERERLAFEHLSARPVEPVAPIDRAALEALVAQHYDPPRTKPRSLWERIDAWLAERWPRPKRDIDPLSGIERIRLPSTLATVLYYAMSLAVIGLVGVVLWREFGRELVARWEGIERVRRGHDRGAGAADFAPRLDGLPDRAAYLAGFDALVAALRARQWLPPIAGLTHAELKRAWLAQDRGQRHPEFATLADRAGAVLYGGASVGRGEVDEVLRFARALLAPSS